MTRLPTREEAEKLFLKYNQSESLYRHAKQVEVTMRYFAKKYGEDQEKWSIIGFLHDLDYEKYPKDHCKYTEIILKENDYPKEYIRAILSHAYDSRTDIKPESIMEKLLYATDELTGLINATCLMRPSKSVLDLEFKSLDKKFKDKNFAQGVNRDVILKGADMAGYTKKELFEETIRALQTYSDEAMLRGSL